MCVYPSLLYRPRPTTRIGLDIYWTLCEHWGLGIQGNGPVLMIRSEYKMYVLYYIYTVDAAVCCWSSCRVLNMFIQCMSAALILAFGLLASQVKQSL